MKNTLNYSNEDYYEQEIILPQKVKDLIDNHHNKTSRSNYLKIYTAFYLKFIKKKNFIGEYISIPSAYLRSFNCRYKRFVKELIENDIIEVLSFKPDTEYYNTETNQSKRYRPLIDIHAGEEITVQLHNKNMNENWYKITKDSLDYLGLKTAIKRCQFGRRLHTPITHRVNEEHGSYKDFFYHKDERFFAIDATACQPHLLKLIFDEKNIGLDYNYEQALNTDFYKYIVANSPMINQSYEEARNVAKELFCIWQNGDAMKSRIFKKFFPKMSMSLEQYKSVDDKTVAKMIQRKESSIFIDDLLNNIQEELKIDFCLTVHDSLVVREKDALKVYYWVQNRIPYLDFKLELIEER